jgi:crotonobetainyl-CoA:carnitine CoA-transferase CaiB-like acyl-CoA transferase
MSTDEGAGSLNVIELAGRTATRVAGRVLADLGASVTRFEGPAFEPAAGEEDAHPAVGPDALAIAWDHGKRVLRPARGDALRDLAHELDGADVLLTSADSGQSALPVPAFAGVHVHVTPFGMTGPYRSHRGAELTAAAFGGLSVYVGAADREPLVPPTMLGAHQTGVMAAIAALASALDGVAERRLVDLAEFELLATSNMAGLYSLAFFSGLVPRRAGHRKPNPYPFTILPCKDGAVCVAFLAGHHWRALLRVMGDPDWASDPRFADRRRMGELHADELDELVGSWLAEHTKAELLDLAVAHDIPFGPLLTVDELLANRQLEDRGFLRRVGAPDGPVLVPGLPFTEEPAASRGLPGRGSPAGAAGPLAGCCVIDLGWVFSAPLVGQMLADMGADVIKVESRSYLDPSRKGMPLIASDVEAGDAGLTPNLMPHFNNVNRGKRSLVLNLRTEAGRDVLMRLVDTADVLLENLGAGSLERLGLAPDLFHEACPELVLARISMAGQDGPDAALPGFAPQSTAIGGLDALCGYEGEPPSGLISLNFGDVSAAMYATAGLLAALRRARATGTGATLDVSMIEANAMHLAPFLVARQLGEEAAAPQGNRHIGYAPHGMFRCAGDDDWVAVAVRSDAEWAALCGLVAAPGHATGMGAAERRERAAEVERWITAWTAGRSARDAFEALQAAAVPAAPALGPEELMLDEHARARDVVVDLDHHLMGFLPVYGSPLHGTPPLGKVRGRAPDLGEHNDEVLEALGLTGDEVRELAEQGAFDDPRVASLTQATEQKG